MPGSPSSPTLTTTAAISAVGLSRRYGGGPTAVDALREVDLTVPAEFFTAVMGPSGSGKSTLLHCLSGLDTATGGQVFLGDIEITRMGERELTRLRRERVGFVFQAFNLLPSLTARENILLPLQLAGRRADSSLLENIVGLLGLAERLDHRPAELSGGQIQRVAVARALITEPQVVFADEPTGNLDRSTTRSHGYARTAGCSPTSPRRPRSDPSKRGSASSGAGPRRCSRCPCSRGDGSPITTDRPGCGRSSSSPACPPSCCG